MDPILGSLMLFTGDFPPNGWAFCEGQLLPLRQYTALFSILGTTYGGDGMTTFALPDLRSRAACGVGQGQGTDSVVLGESFGMEAVALTIDTMPPHTHGSGPTSIGLGGNANADSPSKTPVSSYLGNTGTTDTYSSSGGSQLGAADAALTILPTGSSVPFNVIQPSLGLNYCIALTGVFPQRP